MILPRHGKRLGACALGLAGLLQACGPEADSAGALKVEYMGCASVYRSPFACAPSRSAQALILWLPVELGATVEIRSDGRRLALPSTEQEGGRRYSVPLPASSLTVLVRPRGGATAASWTLPIAQPEDYAWWDEAYRLAPNQARPYLERQRRERPRRDQGFVLQLLAIEARLAGEKQAAVDFYQRAIRAHREAGRVNGEVEAEALLARLYLDQDRFGEARKILARAEESRFGSLPVDAEFDLAYNEGLLAKRLGDYRQALPRLQTAVDLARRLGRDADRWQAEQPLASLFQKLGRARDAVELFRALRDHPQSDDPCERATLTENWGFSVLLMRQAGEDAADPTPELRDALRILDEKRCVTPEQRFNARLNLAFAHQQARRWRESRQVLPKAGAPAAGATLDQRFWWLDLRARAAIEEGEPARALALYDGLAELAARSHSRDGAFQALLGRARTQRALGRRAEALAALARADELIDEQAASVPLQEGRESFVARREEATRLYIAMLLDDGRPRKALEAVRRARSRLLRQLMTSEQIALLAPAERRSWETRVAEYLRWRREVDGETLAQEQLALDERRAAAERQAPGLKRAEESLDRALAGFGSLGSAGAGGLSPPAPREVILAYHPLPEGWAGFALDRQGIAAARFRLPAAELAHPEALARHLLAPFHAQIERAERVRVLPYGPLWSVDFHALPFDGGPLLAHRRVVYSLDLPLRRAAVRPPAAVLISDPLGDLPAARDEGAEIDRVMRSSGWSIAWLKGRDATAEAVKTALAGSTFAHYAGHGSFGGRMGWDSELPLARGSRLTVGDVLTLPRVPDGVVLSGCDTARSSAEAPGEGIGLAQAFLLAGAQAVIAPVRPVDDRVARDLMHDLYGRWRPGGDLSRQLQQAQLASRARGWAGDPWASFRLLER